MKKLFATFAGVVAGVALAAAVSVVGNVLGSSVAYAADSPSCIKVTDGINYNGDNTNATAHVTSGNGCKSHTLVMKTYYAPSATGAPHTKQVLFNTGDSHTLTTNGNDYKFHAARLPGSGCFYQVDLVDLSTPASDGTGNYVVKSLTGGSHDCTPTIVKPACTAFGLTVGNNRNVTISTFSVATGDNITLTGTTINWGDQTAVENVPTALNRTHTYAADGTYTVQVIAHFTFNGQYGDAKTGDALCQASFTYTTPPPATNYINVCKIDTKEIVNIDASLLGTAQYPASNYTTDLSQCVVKNINVCKIDTKEVVVIDASLLGTAQYPASNYTTDLSQCVPTVTPPTPPVVTPPTTTVTTPPTTLVNTGPGSIVALAGVTSIVAAAAHAFWRRRTI